MKHLVLAAAVVVFAACAKAEEAAPAADSPAAAPAPAVDSAAATTPDSMKMDSTSKDTTRKM